MPDCQMCWNDWPTLAKSPFGAVEGEVLCRNCVRDHKHVIAFTRSKGFELVTVDPATGELPGPQVGSQTHPELLNPDTDHGRLSKREEEPPSPPEKPARKAR